MTKKSTRSLQPLKILLGVFGLVVLGIIGYGLTTVMTAAPDGEFVPGKHYVVIDEPRRVRGDQVEVMEFFSYGCIHCFNFDPLLDDWLEDRGTTINFVRSPTVAGELWRMLGQTYFTMQELQLLDAGHSRFFAEIHTLGRGFSSTEEIADWFDGKGTTREQFLTAFNSSNVQRRVASADSIARQMKVISIPSVVVNGKYLVSVNREVGPKRMLEVIDYLVAQEIAAGVVAVGGGIEGE